MNPAEQLASYVSNNEVDNIINKDSIHQLHEQQLSNGENNNHQTIEMVNILGGIDKILSGYLSNNPVQPTLNNHQLNEINKLLITTTTKIKSKSTSKITHYFDEDETFLHSLFGDKKAKTILNILHSKITRIMIIMSMLIWFFLYTSHLLIHSIYLIIVCSFMWIPYDLCWVLSSNKQAFKLVISTFEFWFKVIYGWIFGIFLCLWRYQFNVAHHVGYKTMDLIGTILLNIITLNLVITLISAFDAVKLNKRWKVLFSTMCALICTFFSISYQLMPHDDDYIIDISQNLSLSTQKIISNTSRILAIFVWKQAIVTYFRNNRAVLIRHSAYIKWFNSNSSQLCNVTTSSVDSNADTNINTKSNHIDDDNNIDIMVMPHRKHEVNNENNDNQTI